jgi:ABC-type transport system involved in cytochrome bd biosynthesis fused ATPase/permease subunit
MTAEPDAHRLSTVRSLDRILVFDRREIVEQGTHGSLANRAGGIYRGLLDARRWNSPASRRRNESGIDWCCRHSGAH